MAKRDEVFPSKYLKAADLKNKPVTVTIATAALETLKSLEGGDQVKTVLTFKGTQKSLPLNLTNWNSVAEITGEDDSDDWPGHAIEIYPTTTTMGGKTLECLRIRAPVQRELRALAKQKPKPAPDSDDMDDAIPF